jgi:hypothetical protein
VYRCRSDARQPGELSAAALFLLHGADASEWPATAARNAHISDSGSVPTDIAEIASRTMTVGARGLTSPARILEVKPSDRCA